MDSKSYRYIKSFKSHGVSYFVQYFESADGREDIWKDVQRNKAQIASAVL